MNESYEFDDKMFKFKKNPPRQNDGIGTQPNMVSNDGAKIVSSSKLQLSSRHHSVFAAIMAKIGTYRSGAEINVTANNRCV